LSASIRVKVAETTSYSYIVYYIGCQVFILEFPLLVCHNLDELADRDRKLIIATTNGAILPRPE